MKRMEESERIKEMIKEEGKILKWKCNQGIWLLEEKESWKKK